MQGEKNQNRKECSKVWLTKIDALFLSKGFMSGIMKNNHTRTKKKMKVMFGWQLYIKMDRF